MLNNTTFWVRHRPVRIGWLVDPASMPQVIKAVTANACLWGGRYNPIIPINDHKMARNIVSVFGVDDFYDLSDTDASKETRKLFPHIIEDALRKQVFDPSDPEGDGAHYVDVIHAADHLKRQRSYRSDGRKFTIMDLSEADPLYPAMACHYGFYPVGNANGVNYRAAVMEMLDGNELKVGENEPIPRPDNPILSPFGLAEHHIPRWKPRDWRWPAIVLGSVNEPSDLIFFWNLRAAGTTAIFYDANHAARLAAYAEGLLEYARHQEPLFGDKPQVALWSKNEDWAFPLATEGLSRSHCRYGDDGIWNGMNLKAQEVVFDVNHHDVVGAYSGSPPNSVTLPVPPGPFISDYGRLQSYALSVQTRQYGDRSGDLTFSPPAIIKLNEFFGRQFYFDYNAARADTRDTNTISFIQHASAQTLTLYAVSITGYFQAYFKRLEVNMKQSRAGHVVKRLIGQIGGVQGARVFKVRGARDLIRKLKPNEATTRSTALQRIRNVDPATNAPQFTEHQDLFIERRDAQHLTPDDVFTYLLTKRVFRAGLEPECPSCLQKSWYPLDGLKDDMTCDFCGNSFDLPVQLKSRGDWAFRRSGLFGRDNSQEGGVPVALTLQQLDVALRDGLGAYVVGAEFTSARQDFDNCEADILAVIHGKRGGPVSFLVSECKSDGGEITADDIRKLTKLSEVVEADGYECFILLSKTSRFSDAEVAAAAEVNKAAAAHFRRPRLILWDIDNLEPYRAYEKYQGRLKQKHGPFDLQGMADATVELFPATKPPPWEMPDALQNNQGKQ